MITDDPAPGQDGDASFAEDAITLWGNLLTMVGAHFRDTGTPREDVLDMLRILQETNNETLRSPRIRAIASARMMAVYRVLSDT